MSKMRANAATKNKLGGLLGARRLLEAHSRLATGSGNCPLLWQGHANKICQQDAPLSLGNSTYSASSSESSKLLLRELPGGTSASKIYK